MPKYARTVLQIYSRSLVYSSTQIQSHEFEIMYARSLGDAQLHRLCIASIYLWDNMGLMIVALLWACRDAHEYEAASEIRNCFVDINTECVLPWFFVISLSLLVLLRESERYTEPCLRFRTWRACVTCQSLHDACHTHQVQIVQFLQAPQVFDFSYQIVLQVQDLQLWAEPSERPVITTH